MSSWKRKKQEREGDYFFDGRMYTTRTVASEISTEDLVWIVQDIQSFAKEHNGADYLQEYVQDDTGIRLWLIDQVSRTALQKGEHPEAHHYFTILYPHEY